MTLSYAIKRILFFLLTVWVSATLIFVIPRLIPGDPVRAMIAEIEKTRELIPNAEDVVANWRAKLGLDENVVVQYFKFLKGIVTFDFGVSIHSYPRTANDLMRRALPWSIGLMFVCLVISFTVGTILGALLGWNRGPRWFKATFPVYLLLNAVPSFLFALFLIFLFGFGLRILPYSGGYDISYVPGWNWGFIRSVGRHGILPAMAITLPSIGGWAIGMRSMMITTEGDDYVLLAEAKGLSPWKILMRYRLRNAILPQLTGFALSIGGLVGGATLVENVFGYPGAGSELYGAISRLDYPVIQAFCFIILFNTALAALVVDLLYPLIDPRIRYGHRQ
jgi:peptide/nickel transport system permease protein